MWPLQVNRLHPRILPPRGLEIRRCRGHALGAMDECRHLLEYGKTHRATWSDSLPPGLPTLMPGERKLLTNTYVTIRFRRHTRSQTHVFMTLDDHNWRGLGIFWATPQGLHADLAVMFLLAPGQHRREGQFCRSSLQAAALRNDHSPRQEQEQPR